MLKKIKQNEIFILLLFYIIVAILILSLFNGTGENGSGDSILHYLYAKYAISDFSLFLNHWAKPVFVLLSSPFAQFGFIGIKIFNIIVTLFTLLYTYKIAVTLNLKHPILAPLFLLFTPLFFVLIFSGLTEPLFALFIVLSTHLYANNKYLLGTIILSFLPFVRSEGLIMIGVFAFYLLTKKQWKLVPLFSIGHIFYSIVGYFYYQDFLWVFNKIPYAKLSSTYGEGKLTHFIHQLFYVIGLPIYVLLVIGLLYILYSFLRGKTKFTFNVQNTLILIGFLSFFIAHSLFWYLGIFNSMGLKRVLISVAPLISLIALMGFNITTDNFFIKRKGIKHSLMAILIGSVLILPFTRNKAAINWEKDFSLSDSQILANKCVNYINEIKNSNNNFVFSSPYLSEVLSINYFNNNIRTPLSLKYLESPNKNDIIIWDNWFCYVENGVSKERIMNSDKLTLLKSFTINSDREITYLVLKKK